MLWETWVGGTSSWTWNFSLQAPLSLHAPLWTISFKWIFKPYASPAQQWPSSFSLIFFHFLKFSFIFFHFLKFSQIFLHFHSVSFHFSFIFSHFLSFSFIFFQIFFHFLEFSWIFFHFLLNSRLSTFNRPSCGASPSHKHGLYCG